MNFYRNATEAESRDYNMVEKAFAKISDEMFDKVVDLIGNYVYAYGKERKRAYNKLYRMSRKLMVPVPALENWYFIEAL